MDLEMKRRKRVRQVHSGLKDIPQRILDVAIGALIQANTHAVFHDPGMEHRDHMCILNAASAGELFLKAIIAKEHPLLIFRDLFQLDDPANQDLSIDHIIERGRTYNFEHLPKLLWVATGERIPDFDSFDKLRRARNAIQHFCSPTDRDGLRKIALDFLYKNIDPLIHKHFEIYAIEHHEDHVGYDYVVSCLVGSEYLFSIPDDFKTGEISFADELAETSNGYQKEMKKRISAKGLKLSDI